MRLVLEQTSPKRSSDVGAVTSRGRYLSFYSIDVADVVGAAL